MVHSFAHSRAFLIDSAIKLPAAAPFTMLAVMPSIPADAPCAAFDAACSMLDRPVLTLLIEAFALLTSTSTTSSSLLLLSAISYAVDFWRWSMLPDALFFVVSRRDVEAGDLTDILGSLNHLISTTEIA